MYLGVFSSIVDGGPRCLPGGLPSKYRFYSARHCDLHIAPWTLGGLRSVPCRWRCAPTLTASLSSSRPSDQPPAGGVRGHSGQKVKVELQGQAWTSCGPGGSPARNCQEVWQAPPLPRPPVSRPAPAPREWAGCVGGPQTPFLPPLTKKIPKQLTEVSPRRSSFTKTNPPPAN